MAQQLWSTAGHDVDRHEPRLGYNTYGVPRKVAYVGAKEIGVFPGMTVTVK